MEEFRGTKIRPDVVITGEAVALLVQPASIFHRVIAGIIDSLVPFLGIFSMMQLSRIPGIDRVISVSNSAQAATAFGLILAFWFFLVPIFIEFFTQGRSLGKLIMGTRVVRDDGGPIVLRHAVVRTLIGLGELWLTLGSGAFLTALFNRRSKRIGDFLAGTYVVAEPRPVKHPPLLLAPELAAWAESAKVLPIPDSLAVVSRRFLSRAKLMSPVPRRNQALQLAAELEGYIYPVPPPHTDPERFIAAVLLLRRDTEYQVAQARRDTINRKIAAVKAPKYAI